MEFSAMPKVPVLNPSTCGHFELDQAAPVAGGHGLCQPCDNESAAARHRRALVAQTAKKPFS
jgi:hypothetical protein